VTYDRELLRLWARPEGILLPDEIKRVGDFLDLYASQLAVLGAGPDPTIVQRFAARRCAEVVWQFDRDTSTRETALDLARASSRNVARQVQFSESEIRYRLNNLALEELDSARTFSRVASGAVEVQVGVIPLDQRRRKAK
jgi:hypothetical protein